MNLRFFKYQGAGNDFILLDCRESRASLTKDQIARMCHRNFGIGADGLMYLEPPRHEGDHFYMVYFNADGSESTMCGNGGRCISKFATDLGIAAERLHFHAIDGPHWAEVNGNSVALGMIDAPAVVESHGAFFVDTGSPHHVVLLLWRRQWLLYTTERLPRLCILRPWAGSLLSILKDIGRDDTGKRYRGATRT